METLYTKKQPKLLHPLFTVLAMIFISIMALYIHIVYNTYYTIPTPHTHTLSITHKKTLRQHTLTPPTHSSEPTSHSPYSHPQTHCPVLPFPLECDIDPKQYVII